MALIPIPKFRLPKPFTYIKYVLLAVFVIVLPVLMPFVTHPPCRPERSGFLPVYMPSLLLTEDFSVKQCAPWEPYTDCST